MRAYSSDLRERILHAVDQGKPRAEIIEMFHVSRATIKRYLKLRRETGEVKAKVIPGARRNWLCTLMQLLPNIARSGKRLKECQSVLRR